MALSWAADSGAVASARVSFGAAADLQAQRIGEVQRANFGVLDDLGAGVFRGARQAGEHFARVHGAAGHAANDFQLAGIAPGDGRMLSGGAGTFPIRSGQVGGWAGAAKFPDAGKR
jgi:hypothetical protein